MVITKSKKYVLATELYRSAEQSGMSIRGLEKNTQETTRTWFKVAAGREAIICRIAKGWQSQKRSWRSCSNAPKVPLLK
jgi:hypothetical protein